MTTLPAAPAKLTVYSALWCGDCRRTKRLLDSRGVDYVYVSLDDEPERAEEARAWSGRTNIPVVVFPDGEVFVEPSDQELTAKLAAVGLLA